MIQAGKLRHRLDMMKPIEQPSEYGTGGKVSYSLHRNIKAEKLKLRTEELFKEGTRPQQIIKFRLRYMAELESSWRFVYKGQNFNIIDIDEPKPLREQIITAIRINEQ